MENISSDEEIFWLISVDYQIVIRRTLGKTYRLDFTDNEFNSYFQNKKITVTSNCHNDKYTTIYRKADGDSYYHIPNEPGALALLIPQATKYRYEDIEDLKPLCLDKIKCHLNTCYLYPKIMDVQLDDSEDFCQLLASLAKLTPK